MADRMTRLGFLKETHAMLDKQIKEGYSSFLDDADLSKMKVQKLRYKDQIEKLEKEMHESDQ